MEKTTVKDVIFKTPNDIEVELFVNILSVGNTCYIIYLKNTYKLLLIMNHTMIDSNGLELFEFINKTIRSIYGVENAIDLKKYKFESRLNFKINTKEVDSHIQIFKNEKEKFIWEFNTCYFTTSSCLEYETYKDCVDSLYIVLKKIYGSSILNYRYLLDGVDNESKTNRIQT